MSMEKRSQEKFYRDYYLYCNKLQIHNIPRQLVVSMSYNKRLEQALMINRKLLHNFITKSNYGNNVFIAKLF